MGEVERTTPGTLLGGRVRYAQFRDGYRTGVEPVLLAASVPARAGQRVLEAGTGAGAALLCLAARVPGIAGLGIERDPELASLATDNAAANGMDGPLQFLASAIEDLPDAEAGRYDHAMANPPWHDAAGTPSPDTARDAAKRARPDTLAGWMAALSRGLKHRGLLSLIIPPSNLDLAFGAAPGCALGSLTLRPIWSKAGREAPMLLFQAIRGGRSPTRLLPGLLLHAAEGGYTPEADAVLREGWAAFGP